MAHGVAWERKGTDNKAGLKKKKELKTNLLDSEGKQHTLEK